MHEKMCIHSSQYALGFKLKLIIKLIILLCFLLSRKAKKLPAAFMCSKVSCEKPEFCFGRRLGISLSIFKI